MRGPSPTAEDYIQAEQAVIIWDEAHKTEHFIRQADILTKDPDLGFLVPTPTVPQLVEADPRIFKLAADVGHPLLVQEVVHHRPLQIFGPILGGPLAVAWLPLVTLLTGMSGGEGNEPEILSEQNVAGYHAVTLAANDPAVIVDWLQKNKYVWTPELAAWLRPYLLDNWTLTAFKLIKTDPPKPGRSNDDKPLVTRAIRMSFTTDHPFFPYSEPYDRRQAKNASPLGRTLRIAVLSAKRMQPMMGTTFWWPGNLLFAGSPIPDPKSKWKADDWLSFAKLNGALALPATLTYLRDDSNPRPGREDLNFSPDQSQAPFRRTEIDYSRPAIHHIEFNRPWDDFAALLIVALLPGVPLYCGYRLIQKARREKSGLANLPAGSPWLARFSGFVLILLGSAYGVGCFAITYWLQHEFSKYGEPLPGVCCPPVTIPVGLLFLILVDGGVRMFRPENALEGAHLKRIRRYWLYFVGALAIFVGTCFAWAVIIRLVVTFID